MSKSIIDALVDAREKAIDEDGLIRIGKYDYDLLDGIVKDTWDSAITKAKEVIEYQKTKDTDGKTYHANHPDVIRDQALSHAQASLDELLNNK